MIIIKAKELQLEAKLNEEEELQTRIIKAKNSQQEKYLFRNDK